MKRTDKTGVVDLPHVAIVVALSLTVAARGARTIHAVELDITRADVQRALTMARGSDAARARLHELYTAQIGDATVERVEVITEFRRVVLTAEERARFGDHLYGAREAEEMLRPWRRRVSVVAHLRFHPQNALVSLPPYEVALTGGTPNPPIVPLDVKRTPIYALPPTATGVSPRAGGAKDAGTPLLGATIEIICDAGSLMSGLREVIVRLPPKEIARATIDFGNFQ